MFQLCLWQEAVAAVAGEEGNAEREREHGLEVKS
jgi:hypothetical protein